MTIYVIAQLSFKDRTAYDRYQAAFLPVFRQFQGRLLAADEAPRYLEGEGSAQKVVVMAFENEAEALRFLHAPEYEAISRDRRLGADTVALLVQGLPQRPAS